MGQTRLNYGILTGVIAGSRNAGRHPDGGEFAGLATHAFYVISQKQKQTSFNNQLQPVTGLVGFRFNDPPSGNKPCFGTPIS